MCPVCLAATLLIAGKIAATSGVAVIAVQKLNEKDPASSKENSK
jgi:hypothetical protein